MTFTRALRDKVHFFMNALASFETSAAILPSSRALIEAMLEPLPLATARVIVEYGPGLGAMTRHLLERMREDAVLYAIELDPQLHETLAREIRDPRLRVIHGDAANVQEYLACEGHSTCDVLVSSLGLSFIPAPARDAIWAGTARVLRPDSVVTQFAYMNTRYFIVTLRRGFWRFDAERYLRERFDDVSYRSVWANVPPAHAFALRRPRLMLPPGESQGGAAGGAG